MSLSAHASLQLCDCAGSCCLLSLMTPHVSSGARLHPEQRTNIATLGDNVDVVTWSMTEISCALMCGSLPALRPLLKKIPGLLTTIRGTRPTIEVKETLNRASSRLSFGDKKPVAPAPVITSRHRSVPSPEPSPSEDSFMIKVHISEHLDPRMKPLPPAPLQPLSYQPPWRDSATLQAPRTPMTPMSIRSFRREANADYELDLRGVVNTKTWM